MNMKKSMNRRCHRTLGGVEAYLLLLNAFPPNRHDYALTKCIQTVKQIVHAIPESSTSARFIQWEDLLITKKAIPSTWQVTNLN